MYKQYIVYVSRIYSEPIVSTMKPYFRVRQQYPDAFKALLEKVKPLTKGDFAAKTYQVHELKK
jgi:hypothetical protein